MEECQEELALTDIYMARVRMKKRFRPTPCLVSLSCFSKFYRKIVSRLGLLFLFIKHLSLLVCRCLYGTVKTSYVALV